LLSKTPRAENAQRDLDKADAMNAATSLAHIRSSAPPWKLKPGPCPFR